MIAQIEELRDTRFDGNLTSTARALQVTAAYLSNVINKKRGFSLDLIDEIARVSGKSIAEVLHEREPRWSEGRRWSELLRKAQETEPGLGEDAWRWLGSLSGPLPPGDDAVALGAMAVAWERASARVTARQTKSTVSPSALTTPKRTATG